VSTHTQLHTTVRASLLVRRTASYNRMMLTCASTSRCLLLDIIDTDRLYKMNAASDAFAVIIQDLLLLECMMPTEQ
jgi:hypothetical protein